MKNLQHQHYLTHLVEASEQVSLMQGVGREVSAQDVN